MAKTYNDQPTLFCNLDRSIWKDQIVEQILLTEAPKVLGVHGTWGSGKTSLLAQMYTDFGGSHIFRVKDRDEKAYKKAFLEKFAHKLDDYKPIWFEAWQYQHEPNILAALLKEIRDQLSLPYKFYNRLSEDALVTVTSLLQSVSFKFKAFGAEFGINKVVDHVKENLAQVQQERISEPLDAEIKKRMLQEAIDQLLKLDLIVHNKRRRKGQKYEDENIPRKAIIFIDDLDRCQPDVVYRILETIKVYLNLENCVFVLGIDLEAVEEALALYYAEGGKRKIGN